MLSLHFQYGDSVTRFYDTETICRLLSCAEKRLFSRLTDSELRDLFYQISNPKCSLQRLE